MTGAWALAGLLCAADVSAPESLSITPVVQQSVMALVSERVTAGGAGGGIGAQLTWRRHYLAQLDVTWLWGMGNALATRAALGYQRDGWWSPAAWGTFNLLWGDRIEKLSDEGRRPARPSLGLGARVSPLRFLGAHGSLSALEPGLALNTGGGLWLELTLLQVAARW
jgi:hypothetical protein